MLFRIYYFVKGAFANLLILKIERVHYQHYFEERTSGLYSKHINIIMSDACTLNVLREHHH
jgi:hypothetical protein